MATGPMLIADFSAADAVTLSVIGPAHLPAGEFTDVPISPSETEVFWALPGSFVRRLGGYV